MRREILQCSPYLAMVVVMIVFVVTAVVIVVVIVVIVPVTVVDNNVMPGPHPSLCSRSLPSLLSRCFLRHHWRCLRCLMAAASTVNAVSVSMAAAITSRHGHDLLLRKSLF